MKIFSCFMAIISAKPRKIEKLGPLKIFRCDFRVIKFIFDCSTIPVDQRGHYNKVEISRICDEVQDYFQDNDMY